MYSANNPEMTSSVLGMFDFESACDGWVNCSTITNYYY